MSTTAAGERTATLLPELERAWARSDELFALVRDEGGFLQRGIPLRHPPIFYLGHLPAFAWNQLGRGVLGKGRLHATFDELFERGIDPRCDADGRPVADDAAQWPGLDDVHRYRDAVRDAVREAASALPALAARDELAAGERILHVVLEHELMHHETLVYLLVHLPARFKRAPAGPPEEARAAPPVRSLAIPAGRATLGGDEAHQPFGWDNEFPAAVVDVPAFALDSRPVSLAEFAAFVDEGGYADPRFWSDADRRWLAASGRTAPAEWKHDGDRWLVRTLLDEVELSRVGAWPVHCSQVEARAYLAWAGGRLPSEPELRRAGWGRPDGGERSYPWGEARPSPERGVFDFAVRERDAVGSRPAGRSAFGADELLGNGWEWTSTPFAGLPGYRPTIRTYPGYSRDFFDGLHAVVVGASWPTDARLLRRSFRNWYQTHYPYAFTTFRAARDD